MEKRHSLVMLHGGFHTGSCYLQTPDGRPGWARLLAERGHDVFVPDWPGHGRSPGAHVLTELCTLDVARAMAALLDEVGPSVLVAHSAAGPLAWWLAEQRSDLVVAIVAIAPGPPANLLEPLPDNPEIIRRWNNDTRKGCPVHSPPDQPVVVDAAFVSSFWADSPRFPRHALQAYSASIVAESPNILNERFNIGGRGLAVTDAALVAQRPILVMTGEHDLRHPKEVDQGVARYFKADFDWLPARGVLGNGHMLMVEDNSQALADDIAQWLDARCP